MPTYEYACKKCGTFEYFQKITDEALKSCPKCSSPVERLIAGGAFHLKGSGWYKTDYGSSGSSAPKKSSENSTTEKKDPAPSSDKPSS